MKISCIMPTADRTRFIPQALKYFFSQDYEDKELIIVDDGIHKIASLLPYDERIRYIALSEKLSIGMKRNIAISMAQGEIISFFDDDDFYGPQRLSRQAAPLLAGNAECSAMRMSLLLDLQKGELWHPSDETHRKCFKQDIHYGTLMFLASYWQKGTWFPPCGVGEDRRFLHALLAQDARVEKIVDAGSFAYVLHGRNTTSDMRLVHPDGWQQVPLEEYLSAQERSFYQAFTEKVLAI